MTDLVTLSKTSPEFESYLLGTFSSKKRALPVHTLNVNSASESVTFRLVPVDKINKPGTLHILVQTLKIRSFLLILTPLFLVMAKNIADGSLHDPFAALIATVGVLFAFIAVNLRNDYMDHMKGIDRIIQNSGSRAIQNGWVTAAQIKTCSSWFLGVALFLAVPLALAYPIMFFIFFLAVAVGLWAQFQKENSFKYQIGGELSLFLMFGPLLTVGFQLSMGAHFDKESLWIGCVWGWLVLFIVHLRNFSNIFSCGQAGFKNTVTWLGFDKSRRMLAIWWILFLVFNLSYHLIYAGLYWGFYLALALFIISANFILKLKNISSPMGGELKNLYQSGFYLFLITIGLWIFECLFYLFG